MELAVIPIQDEVDEEKYIVYRPLKGIAFVSNRAMVDLVKTIDVDTASGQSKAAQFLNDIGFLEPDPPFPSITQQKFQPTMAVLLMTNQCQLRCVYCYAGAGENPKEELTFSFGKTAIDHVADNAQKLGRKKFSISLHGGGEPVRAWRTMKACVEYARSKLLEADISITSNGLWSPTQTEWIIANINGISLSMDGSPETQDRQRPTLGGKASSEVVMRNVAMLDKHQSQYGIRMTTIPPFSSLVDDIRFLCEQTQCQSFQVEPAFNIGRNGHAQPTPEEGKAFIESYLNAFEMADGYQRRFYYSGARVGHATDTFCAAPYNSLIVTPNGDLMACYEITSRDHPLVDISTIGQIVDGEVHWDLDAQQHLHQMMAERRDECKDCFCYWTCAGNCYTRSFAPGPDGHLVYGELCQVTRTLVEKLLLWQIAQSDGVWRKQDDQLRLRQNQDELADTEGDQDQTREVTCR